MLSVPLPVCPTVSQAGVLENTSTVPVVALPSTTSAGGVPPSAPISHSAPFWTVTEPWEPDRTPSTA